MNLSAHVSTTEKISPQQILLLLRVGQKIIQNHHQIDFWISQTSLNIQVPVGTTLKKITNDVQWMQKSHKLFFNLIFKHKILLFGYDVE